MGGLGWVGIVPRTFSGGTFSGGAGRSRAGRDVLGRDWTFSGGTFEGVPRGPSIQGPSAHFAGFGRVAYPVQGNSTALVGRAVFKTVAGCDVCSGGVRFS
jgi:hypothetical protein